jgi:hypothetical protein
MADAESNHADKLANQVGDAQGRFNEQVRRKHTTTRSCRHTACIYITLEMQSRKGIPPSDVWDEVDKFSSETKVTAEARKPSGGSSLTHKHPVEAPEYNVSTHI